VSMSKTETLPEGILGQSGLQALQDSARTVEVNAIVGIIIIVYQEPCSRNNLHNGIHIILLPGELLIMIRPIESTVLLGF